MIWQGDKAVKPGRRALRSHVANVLRSMAHDAGESPDGLSEVADSVALYCLGEEDANVLSDDLLSLITARALHGVGREDLADRVVHGKARRSSSLVRYLPLVRCNHVPASLWHSCAAGVVRPASVGTAPNDTVWVVDLSRVGERSGTWLELGVLQVLNRVLCAMLPIWDLSDGRGAMALVARGQPAQEEWLGHARSFMTRANHRQNWRYNPVVFRVDLPVQRRKGPRGR